MAVYPAPTYGQTNVQGMPPPMQVVAPPPVQWIPSPSGRQGCPPGLEHLVDLATMNVLQEMDAVAIGAGIVVSGPNRYSVRNAANQQMYFVAETGGVQYDPYRLIELRIMDSSNRLCMTMRRHPLATRNFCCSCCSENNFSRMEVLTGDGKVLGFAKHVYACCDMKFAILDGTGSEMMTASGSGFQSLNYLLNVNSGSGSAGTIQRVFLGHQARAVTAVDNFVINFPQDLDVVGKAMMLATTLLLDYVFFESQPAYRRQYQRY